MDADTDTNRSKILADFQACTSVDDIETALAILEGADWDLTTAINLVISSDNDPGPNTEQGASASVNGRGLDVTGMGISPRRALHTQYQPTQPPSLFTRTLFNDMPSTSSGRGSVSREMVDDYGVHRRLITFHAQYRDRLHEIVLDDSQTVDDLKDIISARIEEDKSVISLVWENKNTIPEDNMMLHELKLPRENTITVLVAGSRPSMDTNMPLDRTISVDLSRLYELRIEVNITEGQVLKLDIKEPGTKTVAEVKEDIQNRYGIPTFSQVWTGWSSHVTDDMTLAGCQLNTPIHVLTVCRRSSQLPMSNFVDRSRGRGRGPAVRTYTVHSDSDSDSSDVLITEDDIMDIERLSPVQPTRNTREPLIPADIEDAAAAVEQMNVEFGNRYGTQTRPHFYSGSLRDAVDVALQCTASERRLLAVYIHHDESIAANIFCQQVLCSETIVNYLSANFITWGWDITLPVNKRRFLTMFSQIAGRDATDLVKEMRVDQLPVLIVIAKLKGSYEVLTTVKAGSTTEEMMTSLLNAEERFQQARTQDIVEEQERIEREQMKALQDAAYEASLAVDRVKVTV
ncbi:FAF1 [Bugula neritina]|uniref:FAF1 n=1 Tax=Bugula neritina TaxID=10212 RepID=A0A7J7K6B8_BUGNE|nr:FAF1 [Bugula neritina]